MRLYDIETGWFGRLQYRKNATMGSNCSNDKDDYDDALTMMLDGQSSPSRSAQAMPWLYSQAQLNTNERVCALDHTLNE